MNKPKQKEKFLIFGFMKQTETQPKQIFISVRTNFFVCFEDTLLGGEGGRGRRGEDDGEQSPLDKFNREKLKL
jgi:hypothetical protein